MKRLWTIALVACLSQLATAQSTTAPANAGKPAQTPASPSNTGTTATTAPQTQGAKPATPPAQNSATAAPASGAKKQMPQAKTKEEYDAYNAAVAGTDANAADEFAAKFPNSDLRALLYVNMMRKFQGANDAEHTLQMGRKALALEPDNTWALVTTAAVLSERTRSTDIDRDERYAEAIKDAQKAIDTIDTGLEVPPNVTPEQLTTIKNILLSMAHGALGNVALEQNRFPEAEKELKQAIDLTQNQQPDAVAYLRLAIAQDKQNKLQDALANVTKAEQYSAQDPQVSAMVKQEKSRLETLSGAAKK